MVTTVQSTDLDFNAIRNKLKDFFAASDQFADYDFEGAGLSNILDVLAYNTHFNSLVANLAINESFLETAQLRSSLITHAHSLGYFPRSRTSAKEWGAIRFCSCTAIPRPSASGGATSSPSCARATK